jgi:hypothetical protein
MMNERIKSLLVQCTQESIDGQFANPYVDQEKFAELIVRECAEIANRQFSAATGLDDRDCLTAHQMKQHFGVEE